MIGYPIAGTSVDIASDIRWDFETLDLGRVRREISRVLKPYSMEADTHHEHGNGRSLGHVIDYVARELTHGVLFQQQPHRSPAIENLLLASLAHTLDPESSATRASCPYYVRRAEKYILENLTMDLELDGVVAASRVSASTLFRGFRAVHGQGPMGWARDLRLERVRRDLLAATGKPCISDIAFRWGFTHLGNFCAAYRARYGQTPSESLQSLS